MQRLTKAQTLQELQRIKNHHHERREVTKEKNISILMNLVKKCTLDEYNTTLTPKGFINLGFIGEALALNYFNLKREDEMHEIKSIINNPAHILENESVQVVYILVINQKLQGLYRVNASLVYNIRLSIEYLKGLGCEFVKICNLKELIK